MNFVIRKGGDTRQPVVFTWKGGDIPNGITVSTKELTSGAILEGTPVGKGTDDELYHVVKTGKVLVDANGTTITVAKGHDFQVGDYVFAELGGTSGQITAIATNASDATADDITVSASLTVSAGGAIVQGDDSGSGAFLYTPKALVGNSQSYKVGAENNVITNAVVFAVAIEGAIQVGIGDAVKSALKHVEFI